MFIYKDGIYTNEHGVSISLVDPKNPESGYIVDVGNKPYPKELKDKNIFNHMPINLVIKFFTQLVNQKNEEKESFLTKDQLNHFIEKAFLGHSELPKLKLNYSKGQKGYVISLFYLFYKICVTNYDVVDSPEETEKYQKLITGNFDNINHLTVNSHFRIYRGKLPNWPLYTAKLLESNNR